MEWLKGYNELKKSLTTGVDIKEVRFNHFTKIDKLFKIITVLE